MEAFLSRGNGDFVSSHDLEDLFAILVNDADLIDRIAEGSEDIHDFLRSHLRRLATDPVSGPELQGHFSPDAESQRLGEAIVRRLRAL